jgi:hypothetical protein
MLDAFIIEELRRRDELRRRIQERPCLELPEDEEPREIEDDTASSDDQGGSRGVIIIDFGA